MPYVYRDSGGKVKGTASHPPTDAPEEFLADDDPEVLAYLNPPPPTNDEIYDRVIKNQKVFKGYVLAVNDGSIVPGSNMTGAQLKTAVKAKM